MVETEEMNKIVSMRFNQDHSCFVCGTEKGYQIYNTFPYNDVHSRDMRGGLGIVEMLYKSNILALVGGGTHPKYPLNKVMLWDDSQSKCIGELSFKTHVKTVKMRKDKLVVVLEARIYVYNFTDLRLIEAVDTCQNKKGVCALSVQEQGILVCPNKTKGEIYFHNYNTNDTSNKQAHKNAISAIELNSTGSLCATASEKGTLIRVFKTPDLTHVKELRRGKDKADIQSIAFDPTSRWLACTSSTGTIHVFSLGGIEPGAMELANQAEGVPPMVPKEVEVPEEKKTEGKNPTSVLKFMKGLVPYFGSEWSLGQLHTTYGHMLVTFSQDKENTIIGKSLFKLYVGISSVGKYIVAEFDPKTKKECTKKEERPITIAP